MILSDACKIVADYGSPEVHICSGNDEVPNCYAKAEAVLSNKESLANANKYRILKYFKCKDIDDIKTAIYKHGPVIAAYKWYDGYKVIDGELVDNRTGDCGGHAVMIYGWNNKGFLVQNSWGKRWGNSGKCTIPYSIPIKEARGIVDAADDADLREPIKNSLANSIYKLINALANVIIKWLNIE
jgi:hypothetical protein